jgi:hypothetical protein
MLQEFENIKESLFNSREEKENYDDNISLLND